MNAESILEFNKKTIAVDLYKRLVLVKIDEYKNEKANARRDILETEIYELIHTLLEV